MIVGSTPAASSRVEQFVLISGLYRCQRCGRDVNYLLRFRRFRICQRCYNELGIQDMTTYNGPITREEWQRREWVWRWYEEMERRYPVPPRLYGRIPPPWERLREWNLVPFCQECGAPVEPLPSATLGNAPRTLFGGPFRWRCMRCEAEAEVRHILSSPMMQHIRADWDDEDWLDWLYRYHREWFDAGILPDLWFELKRRRSDVDSR